MAEIEYIILDDRNKKGYLENDVIFVNLSGFSDPQIYDDQYGKEFDDTAILQLVNYIKAVEFHEFGHKYNNDPNICLHSHVKDKNDELMGLLGFGMIHCPWCRLTVTLEKYEWNIGVIVFWSYPNDPVADRMYEIYMHRQHITNQLKRMEDSNFYRKLYHREDKGLYSEAEIEAVRITRNENWKEFCEWYLYREKNHKINNIVSDLSHDILDISDTNPLENNIYDLVCRVSEIDRRGYSMKVCVARIHQHYGLSKEKVFMCIMQMIEDGIILKNSVWNEVFLIPHSSIMNIADVLALGKKKVS